VFLSFIYLKEKKKVRDINMSEKISSLLFTLAMASECIGCIKNIKAAKKAKS
jgi:hypothetical protein